MANFVFGELDGAKSERVGALAAALHAAGSITGSATTSSATSGRRWRSFSSFAGMTALMRRPIGPIREDAGTRAMLREGLAEAFAVARAKGIVLPDEFVERTLERCDRLPYEMKSSMLQDLERGRRLELPWLSGAIVRLGRELGVPTPTHAFIATALKLHAPRGGSGPS
jgi:2-dehydropantoate 2-reductase